MCSALKFPAGTNAPGYMVSQGNTVVQGHKKRRILISKILGYNYCHSVYK